MISFVGVSLHFTSPHLAASLLLLLLLLVRFIISFVSFLFSPFAVIRERLVRWLRIVPSSACSRNSFNFAHTEKETGIQSERGRAQGRRRGIDRQSLPMGTYE